MKEKLQRPIKVLCICLCICLLAGFTGHFVDAAPMVGENNTSTKIYRWRVVEDYESLWNIVKKTNEPYRLLLLCGEATSKKKPPKIEEYAIFDRSDENHAFSYVDVSEAQQLAYNDKEFYTRGSMQTPFIEFTGKTHSCSVAGDNAPVCKIYMHDKNDEKSNVQFCSVNGWVTSAQTKLWTPEVYDENEEDWVEKSDEWIFFFPAVTYPDGFATSSGAYTNAVKKYVGLASSMDGKNQNLYMVDWDEDSGTTKYLEQAGDAEWMFYDSSNEMLFKCYIGEEVDAKVAGTFTVHEGQSKSLSDVTLIEEGDVIRVEKGGTLFISGTCYHNGLIINEGGTIILQKGALMTQADSINNTAGMIQLNGGNFVVRDGARLILDEQVSEGRCDITMGGNAYLLNRGLICLANNIKITSEDAILENLKEDILYCGYQVKTGMGVSPGYMAAKIDMTANAYVDYVTEECLSKIEQKRKGYIYNDGGTVINAGSGVTTAN